MGNWRRVDLAPLTYETGIHVEDFSLLEKLRASVIKFGQIQPLIICGTRVLCGRKLLQVLRELGWTQAMAVEVDEAAAELVELSVEITFDLDYVKTAFMVKKLTEQGMDPYDIALVCSFSLERLTYMPMLATFDWTQFDEEFETQDVLFEDEIRPEPPPVPPPAPKSPKPGPTGARAPRSQTSRPSPSPLPAQTPREVPRPPARPRPPAPVQLPPEPEQEPGPARTAPASRPRQQAEPLPLPKQELQPLPAQAPARPVIMFMGEPSPEISTWKASEPPSLDGIKELCLDTETTGLRWFAEDLPIGISYRLPDGRKGYLPWGHAGGNLDEATVKRWAQQELKGKLITGANIPFDFQMLVNWGVNLEEQGCTLSDIQHHAALVDDSRRKFKLNDLATDFLGQQKTGQDLDKTRMADYPAGAVAEYAETDAELTWGVKQALQIEIEKQGLQRVKALEDDVIYPVCEMERNGAPIDRDMLQRWCRESEEEVHQILHELARGIGFMVNPNKNEDMVRLFAQLKIPITTYTGKRMTPSFADSVLKRIDHPIIQQCRRFIKLESVRSKFLIPYNELVGDDWLLRFSLHQLRGDEYGTIRGRFSSSHPNIQQVYSVGNQREAFGFDENDSSHDDEIYLVRRLFVAAVGFFLSSDAEQIEYRLAAHFAESKRLIQAYKDDPWLDQHAVVKDLLLPFRPDMTRKRAKTLNFGQVYGSGEETTARGLGVPTHEAQKFIAAYNQTFPEVKPYLTSVAHEARTKGFVTTLLGRRQRFPDKEYAYKAFNAKDQGSAADIMKMKLVEAHKARKQTGFVMRMTAHDSVTGDCPDQRCAEMVNEILNRQSIELLVPILWKTQIGNNWAEV